MKICVINAQQAVIASLNIPPGGAEVTVGRSPRCALSVKSLTLSREHLRVRVDGQGRIAVTDLESTFGTMVGGERLVPGLARPVRRTDRVKLSDDMAVIFVDFPEVADEADDKTPRAQAGSPVGDEPALVGLGALPAEATIEPSFFPFFLHRYENAAKRIGGTLEKFCVGDAALTAAVDEMRTGVLGLVREMAGCIEISYALNSIFNYQRLLEYVLDMALSVAGAEQGFLCLYNDVADRLETVITRRLETRQAASVQKWLEPLVLRCFSTQMPRIVHDTAADFNLGPTGPELASRVRALALTPLKINRSVIGVLCLLHPRKAHPFGARIADNLKIFAAQAAVAIHSARLYHLATTDGLTGLANHKHFHQRLLEEFRRALRHGLPLSLLSVEMAGLDKLIERHGVAAADRLLRGAARVLQGGVRVHDVAARVGEGEFTLLAPETPLVGAKVLAEKLRRGLAQLKVRAGAEEIYCDVAIGIAELMPGMDRPIQLLEAATTVRAVGGVGGAEAVAGEANPGKAVRAPRAKEPAKTRKGRSEPKS